LHDGRDAGAADFDGRGAGLSGESRNCIRTGRLKRQRFQLLLFVFAGDECSDETPRVDIGRRFLLSRLYAFSI
jgi:hypothetical protein